MGPCCLHRFYQFDTILVVICMGLCELRLRDAVFHIGFIVLLIGLLIFCFVFMGFISLLIVGCVLHWFYGFADTWLCVAWVLSFC